ncbi:MAG: universal stress protein [Acidobacteria bacterium]|nr:universal stress protein [Acidobacteriota bacterium]
MLPVKKILCPTDFSDPSFMALEAAAELARHFSAELIVLNVVPPVPGLDVDFISSSQFDVTAYQKEIERSAESELQKEISKLGNRDIQIRSQILAGGAADQIVRFGQDEQVDLIVIATHGRTGFDRLVFGSVAEKVVRLAGQPVLTIRAPR